MLNSVLVPQRKVHACVSIFSYCSTLSRVLCAILCLPIVHSQMLFNCISRLITLPDFLAKVSPWDDDQKLIDSVYEDMKYME